MFYIKNVNYAKNIKQLSLWNRKKNTSKPCNNYKKQQRQQQIFMNIIINIKHKCIFRMSIKWFKWKRGKERKVMVQVSPASNWPFEDAADLKP